MAFFAVLGMDGITFVLATYLCLIIGSCNIGNSVSYNIVPQLHSVISYPSQNTDVTNIVKQNARFVKSEEENTAATSIVTNVDLERIVANLSHFWESTGFCPPDPHDNASEWFLSADMFQNLAYIAAVPQKGIKQVRIHFLLDTISIRRLNSSGFPEYDFSKLDEFLGYMWQNQLKPGFEIMGNPSNFFSDMENKTQVFMWRDLVAQIANRYVSNFGLEYVRSWNFESWNEPKVHHFDTLPFTLQGFLNYYDACGAGLWSVSRELQLGVPGGACPDHYDPHSYCWALLDHLDHGINFFTSQTGNRADYISIHRKGEEPDNTAWIFRKEEAFVDILKTRLPRLMKLPLYNDEADPLVTWSRDRWWRADATYAAMVAKVIVQHQKKWQSKPGNTIKYELLSNDNGFLSYNPYFFTQRTLMARFQINTTTPHHVQFIRKPVHSVMGLLALLGDMQVEAVVPGAFEDRLDVLASVHKANPLIQQDSWQAAMLVYHSVDSHNTTDLVTLNIKLQGLPNLTNTQTSELMWTAYQLDNARGNPYATWVSQGHPVTPSPAQLQAMREQQDPVRLGDLQIVSLEHNEFKFQLPLPGVLLVHICAKAEYQPNQVTDVSFLNITQNQVLITWSDSCVHSKCLKTYEIQFSKKSGEGPFATINSADTIFTAFVYAPLSHSLSDSDVSGFYRIRAVDYWGRPGEFSLVAKYRQ